ncbi:hypothetical protein ABIE73_003721 [Bradyrhizobium yuanmingense]
MFGNDQIEVLAERFVGREAEPARSMRDSSV